MLNDDTLDIPIDSTACAPPLGFLDGLILSILSWILPLLECKFLRRESNEIYMVRWFLLPKKLQAWCGFGVYIQEFLSPDTDYALHDHPFRWSMGIPLVGGYEEERCDSVSPNMMLYGSGYLETYAREVTRGCINRLDFRTFHRIDSLIGHRTITLFICGPRCQSWGFLVPGRGWVGYRERLRERGIDVGAN